MTNGIINYFYPDIPQEEIKKFTLLSTVFLLIIGSYWMLRILKDTIFLGGIAFPEGVGRINQPLAKMYSVVVVFFAIMVYSKLVDKFKKQTLFYILCSFYSILFLGMTAVLVVYEVFPGVLTTEYRAIFGWSSYFAIESFGSILVALFWSYMASTTTTVSAKRGYPIIVTSGQIGAIGGSLLNLFAPNLIGDKIWPIFLVATAFIVGVIFVVKKIVATVPDELMVGNPEAATTVKRKVGFFEGLFNGLWIIVSRPYIFGILIISTFYEIVATIVDYQMKAQASILYDKTGLLKFMASFGVCVNSLAFLMALLGTGYLMKRFGLRFCLLFYPVTLSCVLVALYSYFNFGAPTSTQLLWATFGAMVIAKSLSYAVNNPTKEMMYIPTSKDAKFKAKGFIDSFGGRLSKMAGSGVNNLFKHNLTELMAYGTLLSFGLIGVWAIAAVFVGIKNAQLVRTGKIVD